jgi:hypothetical protein
MEENIRFESQKWWLCMSVILAMWEAEVGGLNVMLAGDKVQNPNLKNKL